MAEFYVQERAKEPWHVESDDDCETMLCGLFVSVDSSTARVQSRWGPRRCADCWMELERLRRIRAMAPALPA